MCNAHGIQSVQRAMRAWRLNMTKACMTLSVPSPWMWPSLFSALLILQFFNFTRWLDNSETYKIWWLAIPQKERKQRNNFWTKPLRSVSTYQTASSMGQWSSTLARTDGNTQCFGIIVLTKWNYLSSQQHSGSFQKLGWEKHLIMLLIQNRKYGRSLGKFILKQSNI